MAISGIDAHTFSIRDIHKAGEDFPQLVDEIGHTIAASDDARGTIILASRKGLAIQALLPRLNAARGVERSFPILGGLMSDNARLLLDGTSHDQRLVGVTLCGPLRVDAFTSQGIAPVGHDLIVTSAKGHLIRTLGARPALDQLTHARHAARAPLMLGRLIDENSTTRGRADYLMRRIVGTDETTRSLAVDEQIRVGQTVRFHRYDEQTARDDLIMLLDGYQLDSPPAGAIVFSDTARALPDGTIVSDAFRSTAPGESLSRSGKVLSAHRPSFPLLGMGCAGQIAPIGTWAHLHHNAAVVALLRPL